MDELVEAIANRDNIPKESALKRMKETEKMRAKSRRLRYLRRRAKGDEVVKIFTSHSGTKVEVTEKADMERAIMQENSSRFSQNWETPFLSEPLLSEIGLTGTSKAATEIIDSNYHVTPGVDDLTKKFIQHL